MCECVCPCSRDNYHVNKILDLKPFSVFELLWNIFYLDRKVLHFELYQVIEYIVLLGFFSKPLPCPLLSVGYAQGSSPY